MGLASEWLAYLVIVLDVLAIVHVCMSRIGTGRKVVWSLVIILLPVVGLVMWVMAAMHYKKVRL
ncbi:PLDc N-terminal domain-containing protein [Stutzerimonas tarimensis]|uniref:PLDc N-terminal domain-containing protein n=1 Tax=Stutzerimonas tarimensis TaxID=1507735 RepID=A0ABV7TB66_9GAMM